MTLTRTETNRPKRMRAIVSAGAAGVTQKRQCRRLALPALRGATYTRDRCLRIGPGRFAFTMLLLVTRQSPVAAGLLSYLGVERPKIILSGSEQDDVPHLIY